MYIGNSKQRPVELTNHEKLCLNVSHSVLNTLYRSIKENEFLVICGEDGETARFTYEELKAFSDLLFSFSFEGMEMLYFEETEE